MRWSILLGAAAIGAVGAFERRTEPARDESMADLLQQMGGGLDPTKLEAAMKGMGLSGGIGDMAKMMEARARTRTRTRARLRSCARWPCLARAAQPPT